MLMHGFEPIDNAALLEFCLKSVERPYSASENNITMPKVQGMLINGQIVEKIDSIIVLNSLWDAVANKKGYVNEIAAILSIADRTQRPYPIRFLQ